MYTYFKNRNDHEDMYVSAIIVDNFTLKNVCDKIMYLHYQMNDH